MLGKQGFFQAYYTTEREAVHKLLDILYEIQPDLVYKLLDTLADKVNGPPPIDSSIVCLANKVLAHPKLGGHFLKASKLVPVRVPSQAMLADPLRGR